MHLFYVSLTFNGFQYVFSDQTTLSDGWIHLVKYYIPSRVQMPRDHWIRCIFILHEKINYSDIIMIVMVPPITGVSIVYPTICSGIDQRKHQSSASLAFVRGIHQWLVNCPQEGPVTWKMFPFDDIIMSLESSSFMHWDKTVPQAGYVFQILEGQLTLSGWSQTSWGPFY